MIDPSHGKPLASLGVKSGDWVKLVADCAAHSVEIQVPEPMITKVVSTNHMEGVVYVGMEANGRLWGNLTGWCHGDPDRWIQVFRG